MLSLLLLTATLQSPEVIHATIDGVDRRATIFAPTVPSANPPVVFAFHGHGGSDESAAQRMNIQAAWPQAVVVYLCGLPIASAGDPTGQAKGWLVERSETNRDVKLFDAVYARVMPEYHCDKRKAFAMGFSMGAMFVYPLWSLRGDKFAACASIEGCLLESMPLSPKPFFMTIGDKDNIVPTEIQYDTLKTVKQANGASSTSQPFAEKGNLFTGKAPTVLWTYEGGHSYPPECIPAMVQFFRQIADQVDKGR
ncbi:MAG: hypothetical protein JSS72_04045 [Armatimonadetes bacterium]|nr:hypothetical protein [Armatimonadota bacterium]